MTHGQLFEDLMNQLLAAIKAQPRKCNLGYVIDVPRVFDEQTGAWVRTGPNHYEADITLYSEDGTRSYGATASTRGEPASALYAAIGGALEHRDMSPDDRAYWRAFFERACPKALT